ncbi:uncharacterized protein DS421_14g465240 [Arachis hypogaea]|nr:uncharacterized protein DS421_14g465240 [Arachis hypogaea]
MHGSRVRATWRNLQRRVRVPDAYAWIGVLQDDACACLTRTRGLEFCKMTCARA